MKKAFIFVLFFISAIGFSQEKFPTYEKEGNLVKVTYYYDNGAIKIVGFFKDKKLTGEWASYDREGNKTKIAHYNNGKKSGKWFVWSNEFLKEINYKNNRLVSVHDWKSELKLAINNE